MPCCSPPWRGRGHLRCYAPGRAFARGRGQLLLLRPALLRRHLGLREGPPLQVGAHLVTANEGLPQPLDLHGPNVPHQRLRARARDAEFGHQAAAVEQLGERFGHALGSTSIASKVSLISSIRSSSCGVAGRAGRRDKRCETCIVEPPACPVDLPDECRTIAAAVGRNSSPAAGSSAPSTSLWPRSCL